MRSLAALLHLRPEAGSQWPVAVLLVAVFAAANAFGGVLPEDRADVLFHRYDGGGVEIQGPSVLVRKTMAEKYSVSANYYQDMVTSASIDVEVSGASEYKEERTQYSVGADLLRGKTTYSLNYTNSEENDYKAETYTIGISQDLFGDLTTITMGFSRGKDLVQRRDTTTDTIDPTFKQPTDRWTYRVGVSQILTKSAIMALSLETITDEGYLNNPYRSFRFVDPENDTKYRLATEKYPRTHTSNAAAIDARYFLPWRAALNVGYRFYTDTWGIEANTYEVGYKHPFKRFPLTLEASARYYSQGAADFYSDLFPRVDFQNFMGRDKELSTFTSQTVHVGASWEFARDGWGFIKRGSLNLHADRIQFDYEDFHDARDTGLIAGQEPLYAFDAMVYQAFVSIWF